MLSRLICFILVVALLLQMGCAKTVSTIRPEPHQEPGISLPVRVEVTLKGEISLHGTHRDKETTWQTDKVSGYLVAWNDDVVSIRTAGKIDSWDFYYNVPTEDIEKIEVKEVHKGCIGVGVGCLILLIYSLYVISSDPGAFAFPGIGYSQP